MSFRLLDFSPVGAGSHHSGWPAAYGALKQASNSGAEVLLDDYVERTFLFRDHVHHSVVHDRPWIGIFHHPPKLPKWYSEETLEALLDNARWQQSRKSLLGLLGFAPFATRWASREMKCKTLTLRHPIAKPSLRWAPENFLASNVKVLVQVGTFLRDIDAISRISVPKEFHRIRIRQEGAWVDRAEASCRKWFGEPPSSQVEVLGCLSSDNYERLLSKAVVFLKLIGSVANNTLLECIVRGTPVVVNRLTGPEYYLGKSYPLYYDDLAAVPELLTVDRIVEAHEYLSELDTTRFELRQFSRSVVRAVSRLEKSSRGYVL